MKQKLLYALWGVMYILCVGLGTISSPGEFGSAALIFTAVLFFVPGGLLLWDARKANRRKDILRIRIIALCSLILTVIFLVLTVLSVALFPSAGNIIGEILLLVSAPMACGQNYAISLFLWAVLLFASFLPAKTKA